MKFISSTDEAKYTFDGIVPEWRLGQVVVVDVGSGNIKGAYFESAQGGKHVTFSIPLGTKALANKVDSSRGEMGFQEAAQMAKQDILIPQIREQTQVRPGMQTSSRVYLAGGASWALATLTRPCDQQQSITKREERDSLNLV